jgi:hypothetical protein
MEMSNESQGKKRRYFVSFNFSKTNNIRGVGSRIIERESPVSGWDDILGMTGYILSQNPDMEQVVILSWKKFEDPE